jgi:hypothetical protein
LLLEPQRTNLAQYSEQFDNAGWGKTGLGVTANNSTSPDGNTNADKLFNSVGTNGFASQTISLVSSTIYSGSVFAKNAGRDSLFVLFSGSGGNASCTFDLTTLTTTPSGGVTAKIEDYGGGWYRCSVVFTATSTGASAFRIYPSSTTGDGTSGIYTWGAQLEAGAYATSYIPTLGASVTRVADAASKTGITSLIGQTEGTIFAEINFDLGVMPPDNSRIQLSDGTTSNWIFIGMPDGASSNLIRIYVNAPSGSMSAYSTNPLVNGVNKIAYGYKSGSFVLYVNGVQAATSSTTLTMATCSRIDLQGDVPTASAKERTKYNQVLLFKTRLTNAQLADLTTL